MWRQTHAIGSGAAGLRWLLWCVLATAATMLGGGFAFGATGQTRSSARALTPQQLSGPLSVVQGKYAAELISWRHVLEAQQRTHVTAQWSGRQTDFNTAVLTLRLVAAKRILARGSWTMHVRQGADNSGKPTLSVSVRPLDAGARRLSVLPRLPLIAGDYGLPVTLLATAPAQRAVVGSISHRAAAMGCLESDGTFDLRVLRALPLIPRNGAPAYRLRLARTAEIQRSPHSSEIRATALSLQILGQAIGREGIPYHAIVVFRARAAPRRLADLLRYPAVRLIVLGP
jgi:hypothetical protein